MSKYCQNCGTELIGDEICSSCGKSSANKPSNAWYLVPLLFGLLGGIVGYFAVKGKDKRMANSLLGFGIMITTITFVLTNL